MLRTVPYILVGLFMLAGCAGQVGFTGGLLPKVSYSGPTNPPVKPMSFSMDGSVDEVIDRLVDALDGPRFGITHVNPNRGLITAVYRADPEDFVDCGLLNFTASDGTSSQVPAASRQTQHQIGLKNGSTHGVVKRSMKLDGRMIIEVQRDTTQQSLVTVYGDYVVTRISAVSGKPSDPTARRRQLIDFSSGEVGIDPDQKLRCQSNGELESFLLASPGPYADRGVSDIDPSFPVAENRPLLERVREQFEQLPCAPLSVQSTGGSDVIVTGFVSSNDDLQRLRSQIPNLSGIGDVVFRVSITSAAFCDILDVTLPLKELNDVDEARAFVSLANGSFSLPEGEYLVVDATSPRYESYIYVFYAQQDGKLIHMMPNPEVRDNLIAANKNFQIGGEASPRRYSVSAPFGDDMVTLIASTKPLFPVDRPEIEPTDSFARDLANLVADAKAAGADIVADIAFVKTTPPSF